MPFLKCTKIVRDFAGIKPDSLPSALNEPSILGSWYVNMFTVDRKKTLAFMNGRTLMSFIVFGVKKSNCSDLREIFLRGLEQLLLTEDVSVYRTRMVIEQYKAIRYAKTDSRSALGNLNDVVFSYKVNILDRGGFSHCNIGEIIQNINRTPQRNLGWRYSINAMHELLDEYA